MEPTMKADISPLCIHHNKAMVRNDDQKPSARSIHVAEVFSYFACTESGCLQRYDMGLGYYEDGKADSKSRSSKPCTECGFQLYLAKRGETTLDTVWLCANKACPANVH
jgi:hypothetical protein